MSAFDDFLFFLLELIALVLNNKIEPACYNVGMFSVRVHLTSSSDEASCS